MKLTPKILAAVAICATGVGVAVVRADIPDSGVIKGCYLNVDNGHYVRVIDTSAGQTCASNETAISWNQNGPQGPAGPAGPQGPAGPGMHLVSSSGTIPTSGSPLVLTVSCGSSEVGIGAHDNQGADWKLGIGGHSSVALSNPVYTYAGILSFDGNDYPHSWSATFTSGNTGAPGASVTLTAECVPLSP